MAAITALIGHATDFVRAVGSAPDGRVLAFPPCRLQ